MYAWVSLKRLDRPVTKDLLVRVANGSELPPRMSTQISTGNGPTSHDARNICK